MRKHFPAFLLSFIICLLSLTLFAQDGVAERPVEMADTFRSNGKIYVVVATMLILLAGIFFYLLRTENRLRKLERKD